MFTQNRFSWQVISAATATAAASSTAAGLVEQVVLVGRRSAYSGGWRSARKGEMSRHFVTDDPHALGREESDIEASFTSPPHTLFRRRHVDHRDHITDLVKSNTSATDSIEKKNEHQKVRYRRQ